ncbi:MAG: hypothetical protein UY92_C0013G0030 [Candidatus Magasanikbacteria bacterium GW2011_GWA2_56_11]|uniref:Uncharacterized protein n=1 Tax=Candidatus Magasanikbacteria bacterium GW2011_GWA2_56_11 TaxID=1619044 RepID=A0A0G1YF30_9BACT|nr:MAG: hypothetical protein UY92_C0013G0030 [Candidatus Magasanikbacteria bacterium GW2011_GWA2_56_11]
MLPALRSLIARLAPLGIAALTAAAMTLFSLFPQPAVLAGLAFSWWALTILIGWAVEMKARNLTLALCLTITSTALLSLIEWPLARLILIGFSSAAGFAVFEWAALDRPGARLFMHKAGRRIIMTLWVFTVYSWTTAVVGVKIFFPGFPGLLASLLIAGYAALATIMIWTHYQPFRLPLYRLPLSILTLVMAEATLVIIELPFGYLATALLLTWMWYLAQLLLRFHLSPEGVQWRRQAWFLAGNAVLYALVAYFIQVI